MKKFLIKFIHLLITLSFLFFVTCMLYAFSSGIVGRTLKTSTSGCNCHGSSVSSVIVRINGPDTVAPNQTVIYNLTMTGGPLVRGGVDIAVQRGALDTSGNLLQKISDELTHRSPISPLAGTMTVPFKYTAPAVIGKDSIYATGNSVNNNGSTSGDQWNFAPNKIIIVTNLVGIKNNISTVKSFKLEQNFPNPFNPKTLISYSLNKDSFVALKVYDELGNEVGTLVNQKQNSGSYEVVFHGENLSSGVYSYKLETENFREVKRMLLLK